MGRPPIARCSCGARLAMPLPSHCPQCGGAVRRLRHRRYRVVLGIVLIIAMFALLIAYLAWWVGR